MILFETFGLFIVVTLLGVPLVYGLLLSTVAMIWWNGLTHPLTSVFLGYIGGVEPFVLIAVPLFVLAGEVLSRGGVGMRIVTFATKLLGFLPGGLGISTVASCLVFGGVSGSAIADTAAIGSVMTPAMIRKGYSPAFAGALMSTA
ncbi:MAG: TRAP transporter large permease subunit, partial [Caldimonas sp.]